MMSGVAFFCFVVPTVHTREERLLQSPTGTTISALLEPCTRRWRVCKQHGFGTLRVFKRQPEASSFATEGTLSKGQRLIPSRRDTVLKSLLIAMIIWCSILTVCCLCCSCGISGNEESCKPSRKSIRCVRPHMAKLYLSFLSPFVPYSFIAVPALPIDFSLGVTGSVD